jgi:SAM-dependent methyltransferase
MAVAQPENRSVPFSGFSSSDGEYYARHGTDRDRLALWYYARVIRELQPPGGRLLDFGCGTGHLLKRLQGAFHVYAYDPSPYARAEVHRHAPSATVLDDWRTLAPASLDTIVALHVLEHLEDPAGTVAALTARLVGGGLLFAVVPNPEGIGHRLKGPAWFAYRDPTHRALLSAAEWRDILEAGGLTAESVRGDGLWDPPYVPLLPAAVQRLLFGAPALLQILSPLARPFLPAVFGECLVIQARRR